MKFDIFGWRIIIVKLPIELPTSVRGPARDLYRRVVWKRYLPEGASLAQFIRPSINRGVKSELIIKGVRGAIKGRPLVDEKELERLIRRTINSERARLKRC